MGANNSVVSTDEQISQTSAIQRQFWVLHSLAPYSPAYNVPSVCQIEGDLDVAALEQAFNALLRCHPIFRASFNMDTSGTLVQLVSEWEYTSLPLIDLMSSQVNDLNDAIVEQIIIEEIRRPFNLVTGPPLRFKLFRRSRDSYLLAVTAHHIIFDLATKEMFAQELAEEYRAALQGRARTGTVERTDYRAYSAWQEQWLQSEDCRNFEGAWQHYLEGFEPALNLPAERLAAAPLQPSETIVPVRLSGEVLRRVHEFCRAEKVTPFLVLLTAWALTLARWSGQKRLSVGVPLTNRRKDEYKHTMGCFVNILPLCFDISDNPSMRDALRRVRMAMLQLHRMQELPYYNLVQLMRHKGAASGNPLFQAGFTFEQPMPLRLEGVDVKPLYFHHGDAQLDVFATFWEETEAIVGVIEYDCNRFGLPVVERISESLLVAVNELCCGAQRKVEDVALIPGKHLDLILNSWNDTMRDYPTDPCIHELFAVQAVRTPNAVAVEFEGRRLTYSELDSLSRLLASHLKRLGIGPDILVALYIDRSLDMVVAMLGILRAGGAYLPLDRKFPRERLAFMIEDARPLVLVTLSKLLDELPPHQATVVCVDDFPTADVETLADDCPTRDSLAYVLYTSGSTGKPKGVEIPHGAVINFLSSMREIPGMTPHDTLLSVTTISFDILGLEVWLPLTTGARVVLVPENIVIEGKLLAKAISDCNATVMQATPSTWRLLLDSGWEGSSSLKILCGGEAWSQELAGPLLSRCASLWNMYGPTETTIWSAVYQVRDRNPVIVGRPIANTQFYILDANLLPVPIGVPGELLIGGRGLARGYLNRPELTDEKFIPDPFNLDKGSRLYRTGDIARYLPDGNVEYLGRMDHQVKIRGFRIELSEIEIALGEHEDINYAVVTAREDTPGDKQLVAYIIPNEGRTPSIGILRQHLREKLPEYMLPGAFVVMEKFPLTPNGKIDRKSLPTPETGRLQTDERFIVPRTEAERLITGIWQEILHLEKLGVKDNFFDLGGNSLHMTQVHVRLCKMMQREVSMLEMFQYPTISSLAEYLNQQGDETVPAKDDDRAAKLKLGKNRLKMRIRRRDECSLN